MEKSPIPFVRTVFVCTNVRSGGIVACGNPGRGGDLICKALKESIKKEGLSSQVRVARSGCLDQCAKGPNLMLFPDGELITGAAQGDVPALLARIRPQDAG